MAVLTTTVIAAPTVLTRGHRIRVSKKSLPAIFFELLREKEREREGGREGGREIMDAVVGGSNCFGVASVDYSR